MDELGLEEGRSSVARRDQGSWPLHHPVVVNTQPADRDWASPQVPPRRSAFRGDVDDGFGEGLRRFLGQIVPDAALDGSV